MMLIYNFCTGGFNRVFPDVKLRLNSALKFLFFIGAPVLF
ncbi:hypothetical protein AC41_5277 [Escherichia coli 2-011-08_S3_C3]|nr:hypothetical protein AC41_5277 [Escherichia coli 2-011-08_S3_C3]KDT06439.1 hypothetical protein AB83_5397 [Escherichia coli 2-011-08_S3_C1]KEM81555.1 hypothetical protein AB95_5422 [Escherichia coli 7-233-03_S3_C1]